MKKIISLLIPLCVAFAMVTAVSFADTSEPEQTPGEGLAVQMQEDQVVDPAVDAAKGAEATSSEKTEPTEESGDMLSADGTSGWVYDSAAQGWKYIDPSTGAAAVGKVLIGGATYFFDRTTTIMKTGLVHDTQTGDRYYCCPDGTDPSVVGSKLGAMQEGWKTLTNGKYYFMPSTYKAKAGGWLTDKGYKYYFGNNAVMKVGWLKVNDSKYYLEPKDGASQGRMYTGMHKISGATYYFDTTSGKMKTGWVKDGSDKYYFASNGKMKKGWLSLHGSKYYLNKSNGKMYTGRKKVSGSYYYFDTSSGKMLKNSAKKFNGKLHYFFASGKEVTGKGWFKGSDGKSRYAIGGGAVATGMWTISHIKYKFDSKTGVCVKSYGDKYDQKIQSYSSNTGKLIYVIKGKHQVRVYKGSKGNWSKIYTFTCSLGASSTPTYSGTYTVRGKTAHHNYTKSGQPAHWNNGLDLTGSGASGNGFNGYVWSGKYPDGHIIDSKLGANCTGGRVRVSESNSVWLFNNIGVGTKVLIQ